MSDTSLDLLRRLREGDEAAADAIYRRYSERLIRLAQQRLSPRITRRVSPEDIVQSAYRSFFRAAASSPEMAQRKDGLWRMLAQITINKLLSQIERHQAERRDVRREEAASQMVSELEAASSEPTPDETAALTEEIQWVAEQLDARQQRAFEMRLEGCSVEEISRQSNCTERTVRRWLAYAGELLVRRQQHWERR